MALPNSSQLSRRERQIMDVLYRRGRASAEEVCKALSDPPTTTTVRGLLRILEEKGYVLHDVDGLRYIYRSAVSREEAAAELLPQMVQTLFGGSPSRVMAALLGPDGDDLDAAEIERLSALIEQAKRRKGSA